jgi:hypothetical protein
MSARNLKSSKWHNEYIESSRVLKKERLVNENTRLRGLRTESAIPHYSARSGSKIFAGKSAPFYLVSILSERQRLMENAMKHKLLASSYHAYFEGQGILEPAGSNKQLIDIFE